MMGAKEARLLLSSQETKELLRKRAKSWLEDNVEKQIVARAKEGCDNYCFAVPAELMTECFHILAELNYNVSVYGHRSSDKNFYNMRVKW